MTTKLPVPFTIMSVNVCSPEKTLLAFVLATVLSTSISSAFTVIPSPAPTFIVLDVVILPPPIKPLPAVILTPLWSMCSLETKPVVESCDICTDELTIVFPSNVEILDSLFVTLVEKLPLSVCKFDISPSFVVIRVLKDPESVCRLDISVSLSDTLVENEPESVCKSDISDSFVETLVLNEPLSV